MKGIEVNVKINKKDGQGRVLIPVEIVRYNSKTLVVRLRNGDIIKRKKSRDID